MAIPKEVPILGAETGVKGFRTKYVGKNVYYDYTSEAKGKRDSGVSRERSA